VIAAAQPRGPVPRIGLLDNGSLTARASLWDAEGRNKILKGVKPGDLPIEQPKEFELVVNQTTAKKLGLAIPPSIMLRAEIVQ
jgi:hypothetical protein